MPNSPSALRLSTVARVGSPGKGENTMDEKNLLDLWNTKRSQIIKAQMAPNLMLIGIFVLAAFGKFDGASDGAKYLTIGVAAATGILAMITQYATIREAEALIVDLNRVEKPSELAKKIASSRGLVSLFAIAIVGLGLAVFALVVWAVLG
jgi:aldehyde:ferredoxin oxidoreductase